MEEEDLIAIRVKDGIFIGNAITSKDFEFIEMNKIVRIINCSSGEVSNLFEDSIEYMSFNWEYKGNGNVIIFDPADQIIEQVISFIDKALENGNCVLIHSYMGNNRSCVLFIAYMIVRYGWTLESTLAYTRIAHQNMHIQPSYMNRLRQLAQRHQSSIDIFNVNADVSKLPMDHEQLTLRNSYLNGLNMACQRENCLYMNSIDKKDTAEHKPSVDKQKRITFLDTKKGTDFETDQSVPLANRIPHVDLSNITLNIYGRPSILSQLGTKSPRAVQSNTDPFHRSRLFLTKKDNSETKLNSKINQTNIDTSPFSHKAGYSNNMEYCNHSTQSKIIDKNDITTLLPLKLSFDSCISKDSFIKSKSPATTSMISNKSQNKVKSMHSPFALSSVIAKSKARRGSPLPVNKTNSAKREQNVQNMLKYSTLVHSKGNSLNYASSTTSSRAQSKSMNDSNPYASNVTAIINGSGKVLRGSTLNKNKIANASFESKRHNYDFLTTVDKNSCNTVNADSKSKYYNPTSNLNVSSNNNLNTSSNELKQSRLKMGNSRSLNLSMERTNLNLKANQSTLKQKDSRPSSVIKNEIRKRDSPLSRLSSPFSKSRPDITKRNSPSKNAMRNPAVSKPIRNYSPVSQHKTSILDQFYGNSNKAPQLRETNSSILRKKSNLTAHRQ